VQAAGFLLCGSLERLVTMKFEMTKCNQCGSEMLMGADGWVAGLVCAFPAETVAIYRLVKAGRIEEALASDSDERRRARQDLVANMSWEARVNEAWGVVEERLRNRRPQPFNEVALTQECL